jgi:hypothetical protein
MRTLEEIRLARQAANARHLARKRGEDVPFLISVRRRIANADLPPKKRGSQRRLPAQTLEERQRLDTEYARSWANRNVAWSLFTKAEKGARHSKKGPFEFTLTLEWVEEHLASGVCEVSGHPLGKLSSRDPWAPSIDRIDSGKGYTPENCQVVCWIYNRAKGADSDAEVLEMARFLVLRYGP